MAPDSPVSSRPLSSSLRPPIGEHFQINAERDDFKLRFFADLEFFVDFPKLLTADDDDFIGSKTRQRFFDNQKSFSFQTAVITVKNMPVKCVDDFYVFPGKPAIEKTRGAPDRSCFGGVRVNNVGLFAL